MQTGQAAEFWTRYEEDFATCRRMGLNSFRLGIEWARVQPSYHPPHSHETATPDFDRRALDAYSDRIAACRKAGLEPIVTLHHFTHPSWLGMDAWLHESTIDHFVHYVRTTVLHINRRLTDIHHLPPVRWYVTINEPNMLVTNTYFGRQFPSDSLPGFQTMLPAYNHLLTAHVRAYNCIHDIYENKRWSVPQVSLNTYCSDLYWSEKVVWDLLAYQERGVHPTELRDYTRHKATELETALQKAHLPFRQDIPYKIGRIIQRVADAVGSRAFDIRKFDRFLHAVNASPRPHTFDFVGIDYYDPFIAHTIRLPSFSDFEFETKGIRAWLMSGITSKWWDWRSLPEGMHFFCQHYSKDLGDRPVLIAENGMALRRKPDNSIASHRADQLRRSEFLKAHVREVQRILDDGVPLVGYMHWSLTDNYEWGSYTPRFGLFSIDFAHGSDRLVEDHLGDRPSETYARLIREFKARHTSEERIVA